MRFQFDANQTYQLRAIDSVAGVFAGLVRESTTVRMNYGRMGDYDVDVLKFSLDEKRLLANIRKVQEANGLEPDTELKLISGTVEQGDKKKSKPVEMRFPNISVEMETGTGKTYCYIRTALELNRRYQLKKFIIVVPSVAVREAVMKTYEVTRGHFLELFDNVSYRFDLYDSKNLTRLKTFAEDDEVRFLVMTIDSFNKEQNVIAQSRDQLQGKIGLHMIQAVRPVLILDEPQNMESAGSKQALLKLNPLLALRYSATHRDPYNRIYRLSPYDAYRQGLVKKIEVASVVAEGDDNRPYIRVTALSSTKKSVTAKVEVHQRMAAGTIKAKEYAFKPGDNLERRAERSEYAGFEISEIDVSTRSVTFTNGVVVKEGEPYGANQRELFRQQIRYTVEQHFRRQEALRSAGIKVLSLFFIDKVDNYAAEDGIIRTLFVEAFEELKLKYPAWAKRTCQEVSGAYFAKKKRKGGTEELLESSGGESENDRAAYALIMKEKERLLSFDEPVAFLFSHSALREGWDNPNVFQICTLNQSTSEVKKRQEIGRGLRIAVNQTGERFFDEKINVLTVVANESYEDFVEALQKEIEADYGSDEAKKVRGTTTNARDKKQIAQKSRESLPPEFQILWDRIKAKTRYSVTIDTPNLIQRVLADLNKLTIEPPRIVVTKARVETKGTDTFAALQMSGAKTVATLAGNFPLPNLVDKLAELLEHTNPPVRLTRQSLLDIIRGIKLPQAVLDNPEEFALLAAQTIRQRLEEELVAGVQYEKDGTWYDMSQWVDVIETTSEKVIDATKSLYERFVYDSEVERRFAEKLESMGPVKFYVKLPNWFKVATPIGTYNPDWALVWEETDEFGEAGEKLYLVRETKGTTNLAELYLAEQQKIRCGSKHFHQALETDFRVLEKADDLPGGTRV